MQNKHSALFGARSKQAKDEITITVLSDCNFLLRMCAELNEITSVENLALVEAQQTLVLITLKKIETFPNLLGF